MRTPLGFLRLILAGAILAGSTVAPSWAQSGGSLSDRAEFRDGCQALSDGRYANAVRSFLDCWEGIGETDAGDMEKNSVAARLLESMVRQGDGRAACKWMEKNRTFHATPASLRWMAAASLQAWRYRDAAHYFELYLAATPEPDDVILAQYAAALSQNGNYTRALEVAGNLPHESEPAYTLLQARIALSAVRPELADEVLSALLGGGVKLDAEQEALARRLWIRALQALGREDEVTRETLILLQDQRDAKTPWLAMTLLDEVGTTGTINQVVEALLPRQAGAESHPMLAYALGAWSAPEEEWRTELSRILRESGEPYLRWDAAVRMEASGGGLPAAVSLPAARDPLSRYLANQQTHARAAQEWESGRLADAMETFYRQSRTQQGSERALTLYNAAIAALHLGNASRYDSLVNELRQVAPESPLLADLSYQGGMFYAAQGDAAAAELLQQFVQDHADHVSHVDAQLALAGLHLNQVPARPQAVWDILHRLSGQPLSLAQSERYDYTAIWVDKVENASEDLIRRAEAFLEEWPGSRYLADVAMLLAGEYYERQNFEPAQRHFQRVADDFPDAPYARQARFFSAKSSPAGEEAVARWETLLGGEDELALAAHHELGLLCLSLDQFDDAREIFRSLSRVAPEDSPYRYAAMLDVGFSWYAEALSKAGDGGCLERAEQAFAQLAAHEEAPAFWRYSAVARRGKCLEVRGQPDEALKLYQSLVAGKGTEDVLAPPMSPREMEWVFRAGFSAIELMKQKEDWKGAIALADTLSMIDGPRAIDAARLAENIRLQRWVWD